MNENQKEQLYKDFVKIVIGEYLEDNLDSSIFNFENITQEVLEEYVKENDIDVFRNQIHEEIEDILAKKFKIYPC